MAWNAPPLLSHDPSHEAAAPQLEQNAAIVRSRAWPNRGGVGERGNSRHALIFSERPQGVLMATDLKNVLRQEAAQCRRLAELVTEQTIRQALMEMAARLEALAHEDSNDEQ
jgi:hypothetical protein